MRPDDLSVYQWVPLREGGELRIEISPGPASVRNGSTHGAVEAEWAKLCKANPRYFDGPILVCEHVDGQRGVVRAGRASYKLLAVQPVVETGVRQLGVTGVLEAGDAHARPHVLLGRRSHETRVYGGMWELGPSGGVDAPPVSEESMDASDLWRVLLNEIREEIGLPIDPDPAPPVGALTDPIGMSVELVVRVQIVRPVEELLGVIEDESGTNRWEYDAVRWVGIDEIAAFDDAEAERIVPPTRALFRALGWV